MHSLSIFGTSSDAGKSTLAFALTYLLHHRGLHVAPFKAQNVSNNSLVTDIDNGEIAIPQAFAAESIGLQTTVLFNPILLKSGGAGKAHMIVNGKSIGNTDVRSYYKDINRLKPVVKEAFTTLKKEYDCIIAEGAGSPVELNLMDKDLSNIYTAEEFHTKIVLVADIQRGGVFASIYGVYKLLPKKLRKNVIGVIVNKFQGDISLFEEGVRIIERDFGIKVLGVVPFKPFNLGFEDSASLMNYTQKISQSIISVAVIKLPHISNFTDFEPLVADEEIELNFITNPKEARHCDLLIIPGSKRVIDDLLWMKNRGFSSVVTSRKNNIFAICGGYEMLFETIYDPEHIESTNETVEGFGRFKGSVLFVQKKIVQKGCYNLQGIMVKGYEIHNGVAKKRAKKKKNCYGTFVHGVFESDAFRYKVFHKINKKYKGYNFQKFKQKAIADFAKHIDTHVDVDYIQKALDA